jgi:hypothetical protein
MEDSMTMLERTDLTTPEKVQLAAAAAAGQGEYGAVSELAMVFGVSRATVHDVQKRARAMLVAELDPEGDAALGAWILVDRRQVERAVVALRVVAPNSVRSIEDLLPILYPGVAPSYGAVQAIAAEAERRSAQWNATSDLSGIEAGALDEMFSQGAPVLGAVDLDSGALFALALRESRSGDDWAEVLEACRKQGLNLEVAVKDAALGIQKGVQQVFPNAEHRDDCFHALYEMGKVQRCLESRAYGAMSRVEEAELAIDRLRCSTRGDGNRRKLVRKLVWTRRRCDDAITLHARFEAAQRRVQEALELVDLDRVTIRTGAWMQSEIQRAAIEMLALDDDACRKVGRYIHNRAPGLSLYAVEVKGQLDELSSRYGDQVVRLACVVWRLKEEQCRGRRRWRRSEDQRYLVAAFGLLKCQAGPRADAVLCQVDAIMQRRHRASSAIEGFNAALRPFLYVHKGVTQGFLELFRTHYNLRIRRWGRHKGTAAHELLTGECNEDWLTTLGYPPSAVLN